MNLFSELITGVQSDLNVDNNSTLFPLDTIKLAINRAYLKASGLFRWPETEDAKKTSTQANVEYYDYPQNWRPDTIWKLTVDGKDYADPLDFKDYLYEKESNIPSGNTYLWSSQWRRYFIYPTPTVAGDNNISVWGQRTVDELVNEEEDYTIWSYSMPECNEAVVLEAVAILKAKGEDEKSSSFKSSEAKGILIMAWNRIKQDQAKMEKTTPFLDVPDFFSRNGGNIGGDIGNF